MSGGLQSAGPGDGDLLVGLYNLESAQGRGVAGTLSVAASHNGGTAPVLTGTTAEKSAVF